MTTQKDEFLTPVELAKRWGVPTGTLANWRSAGLGPGFHKFGALVRYALAEVLAYETNTHVKSRLDTS